jgi:uncharacterized protein YdaU (DUF1376 family)
MKHPWMPFYIGDYLANTAHLSRSNHGSYLMMLFHYWVHDGLPTDPQQLMAIAKMTPEEWSGNCHIMAEFFDNKWRHKRMDKELTKAKNISEKRALAGLKGAWSKHRKYEGSNVWQMPPQSQSHIDSLKRLSERARKKD